MRKKNKDNYGSFDCNYKSLPSMNEHSIGVPYADEDDEGNASDLEQDPVANNYDITNLSDGFSDGSVSFEKKEKSYIIEPVAFVQNLAASTMTVSVGQFVYSRIYKRLIREASQPYSNATTNHNHTNQFYSNYLSSSNPHLECSENSSNKTLLKMYNSYGYVAVLKQLSLNLKQSSSIIYFKPL